MRPDGHCEAYRTGRESRRHAPPLHGILTSGQRNGHAAAPAYRVREHLTEVEVGKLLATLRLNRHGQRDWLIALLIYRHGLRVSEACDLRWPDIDLAKRTIIVRRRKGSTDSTHYLERDEHKALGALWRAQAKDGTKSEYVFINERGAPFGWERGKPCDVQDAVPIAES